MAGAGEGVGRPSLPGEIVQTAFVVRDIAQAMPRYTAALGAGPWFLRSRFRPIGATHRGQPTDLVLSLAFGYAGAMMIELIEQHDDAPSVFAEVVQRRGYGFHHFGIATASFDQALEDCTGKGYAVAFTARRAGRLAILDTHDDFPGMIELLEMRPEVEAVFASMRAAAAGWDGRDPIRSLPA